MLGVREISQVGVGFGEKLAGLGLEFVGTVVGNERLKDSGRQLEKAANERLESFENAVRSAKKQAEARAHETKQRTHQRNGGSKKKAPSNDPSAGRAVAETAKGAVKQAAGKVTGKDDLEAEGREQKERGKDEGSAAKHEAKADAHREKADAHREASEQLRR
jgi:uncharacterized protein YjbJ (UPF0337 family)